MHPLILQFLSNILLQNLTTCPVLVIEDGTMTYSEYEAHIRSRRDFVRIARKDGSGERQVTGHRCCCPSQEEKGGDGGMWVRKTLV